MKWGLKLTQWYMYIKVINIKWCGEKLIQKWPITGGFPAQMVRNVERVCMPWPHLRKMSMNRSSLAPHLTLATKQHTADQYVWQNRYWTELIGEFDQLLQKKHSYSVQPTYTGTEIGFTSLHHRQPREKLKIETILTLYVLNFSEGT